MLVKTLHRAFCIAIDGFANDLEKCPMTALKCNVYIQLFANSRLSLEKAELLVD